jgi:hypothetical protein
MSGGQSVGPKKTWLPLRRAVFAFGMTEDEALAAIHDRPFLELSKEEVGSAAPYSRRQLAKKLKQLSGADDAEIDPDRSTFSFDFSALAIGGPPWGFLDRPETVPTDPRADAESLFNKEGIVRISDEEAAFHQRQRESVSKATGVVFRQLMLRSFAQAVATSSIKLYAQIGSVSERFQQFPATVWPLLEVVDWNNGIAIAPDRTTYWSIHVAGSGKAKGGFRQWSRSQIIAFVMDYFDRETAAGRTPTSAGCEEAARIAGIKGRRKEIREAFKECQTSRGIAIRVGRPGKSPK